MKGHRDRGGRAISKRAADLRCKGTKIFDSFYTTKPGGMGMGLSISRSILQSHGGRLWVTASDGSGTSLHFAIPKYHEEGLSAGA